MYCICEERRYFLGDNIRLMAYCPEERMGNPSIVPGNMI